MRRLRASLAIAAILLMAVPTLASASSRPTDFSLLQLNLCLSGYAGCFAGGEYPAVVNEAITTIQETDADAVTVNEACSGDIATIAAATGYDFEFGTVIYNGGELACKPPEGRGVFGIAVLTKADITATEGAAYEAQQGSEERRWLCVETTDDVRACTTHLAVGSQVETNQAQCEEFTSLLADLPRRDAAIVGSDFNRQEPCTPLGAWSERDEEALQAPGIQHVYGIRPAVARPRDEVIPLTYTDHDGLLVRTLLTR